MKNTRIYVLRKIKVFEEKECKIKKCVNRKMNPDVEGNNSDTTDTLRIKKCYKCGKKGHKKSQRKTKCRKSSHKKEIRTQRWKNAEDQSKFVYVKIKLDSGIDITIINKFRWKANSINKCVNCFCLK